MSTVTGSCSESLASELSRQGLQLQLQLQQRAVERRALEEVQNRQTVQEQSATSEDTQLQNGQGKSLNDGVIGTLLDTYA